MVANVNARPLRCLVACSQRRSLECVIQKAKTFVDSKTFSSSRLLKLLLAFVFQLIRDFLEGKHGKGDNRQ
jgi:hypothetical protein